MGLCVSGAAAQDFAVVHLTLTKEPGCNSFGLHLKRLRNGRIIVQGVARHSSIARWNNEHPLQDVDVGDKVVSVNGAVAKDAMQVWYTANRFCSRVSLIVVRSALRMLEQQQPGLQPADFLQRLERDLGSALGSDCAICLEELRKNESVVVLPCRHAFHYACAEQWLARSRHPRFAKCPTCRKSPVESRGKVEEPFDMSVGVATTPPPRHERRDVEAQTGA